MRCSGRAAMGCGASTDAGGKRSTPSLADHLEGGASPTEERRAVEGVLAREQRERMMAEANAAANAAVDYDHLNEAEVRDLFAEIDTNGGGSLDKQEITQLLMKLGMPVDEAQVNEVIAAMHANGDGDVTLPEFLEWWRLAGADLKAKMTQLADGALEEQERERRAKAREAAAAAARMKAEEKMKMFQQQLQRDLMREWLVAAKNQRKERHEALVKKLRARFGNNSLALVVDIWKEHVRAVQQARQDELERVASTDLQRLIRGHRERDDYKRMKVGVTKMQSIHRGRLLRGDLYIKNRSAARIQACFKGRRQRRQMLKRKPGRGEVRPPLDQTDLLVAGAPPAREARGCRPEGTIRAAAAKEGSADADTKKAREKKLEQQELRRLEKTLSREVSVKYAKDKVAEVKAEKLSAKLRENVLQLDARDFTGRPEDIYREARAALQWILDELPSDADTAHQLIEAGAIPRLIKLTSDGANAELSLLVAWVLTNITGVAGLEDLAQIVNNGVLRVLIIMLFHVDGHVREQATWCLGNVIADNTVYRDTALHEGAMAPLLSHAMTAAKEEYLNDHVAPGRAKRHWARRISRTLCNLCGGSPRPEYSEVKIALPLLGRLLFEDDDHVLDHTLITLALLSSTGRESVHAVLSCHEGVARRLVGILRHPVREIKARSLCVIANVCASSCYVVTGDDSEVQSMVDGNIFPELVTLLHADREKEHVVVRRALRVLANIFAGKRRQLHAALDSDTTSRHTPEGRFIPLVCDIICSCSYSIDYERDIIEEAAWVINNATLGAPERVVNILTDGCMEMLCDGGSLVAPAICAADTTGSTLLVGLEALQNVFAALVNKRDELLRLKKQGSSLNNKMRAVRNELTQQLQQIDMDEDFVPIADHLAHLCSHHQVAEVRHRSGGLLTRFLGYSAQQVETLCAQALQQEEDSDSRFGQRDNAKPQMSEHEAARRIQSFRRGRAQRMALMIRKPGRGELRKPVTFWSEDMGLAQQDLPLDKSSRQGDTGAVLSTNRKVGPDRRKMQILEQLQVLGTLQPLLEEHEDGLTFLESNLGKQVESGACQALAALRDLHSELCIGDIGEDLVPILISFLRPNVSPVMQLEAAWTLTNMTAGRTSAPSQLIQQYGGFELAINLLQSRNGNVREQAVWMLGNIAADNTALRDDLLSTQVELPHNQGFTNIIELLKQHAADARTSEYLHEVVGSGRFLHHWARRIARLISNLCFPRPGEHEPEFEVVSPILPLLGELVNESDKDVLDHALLALQSLSANCRTRVNALVRCTDIMKRGVVVQRTNRMCESLVGLLKHHVIYVRARVLGVIANICAANSYVPTGDDSEVQSMLDAGLLPNLLLLLHSDMLEEHCVLRRAIRVTANICAGNRLQVQQVLALDATSRVTPAGRIFPLLVALHARAPSTHLDIVEEVVWAINNASHGACASDGDFQVMMDDGCFAALEYSISPSVATQDTDGVILRPALEAIGNMLRGLRQTEQVAIDREMFDLKLLGKPYEHLASKRPTAWAASVPTVFLQRLAERHLSAFVCEQARAVLTEFDSAAAA